MEQFEKEKNNLIKLNEKNSELKEAEHDLLEESADARWKKQYLAELNGQTPKSGKAMTPEQQEIQSLKKQLWRAKRDNEILKKATALFAMDNQ